MAHRSAGKMPFLSADSGVHATSPRSDVTDESVSSYDDGPAEIGGVRDFPRLEQRLYVINRAGKGEASYLLLTEDQKTILSYRVHTEKWRPIVDVMNFGAVVLGKYIYVIGGFHRSRAVCLNRVLRYDTCEGDWFECSNLVLARSKFGVCALDGKIFVCGGERTDGKTTGSCELYDPETNTWSKCGMLISPRTNPACAAFGKDMALCAGGFYGGTAHNNLWVYEEHQWQEMDEDYPHRLPYCLDKCATASVDSTVFFIGGISTLHGNQYVTQKQRHHDTHELKHHHHQQQHQHQRGAQNGTRQHHSHHDDKPKVKERPKFMTESRMFSYSTLISATSTTPTGQHPDLISPWNFKLPPMIHSRHSAGAVTIGNKIHVVGGTSIETGQTVNVSEHYDLTKGIWEEDFTLRKCDVSNVCCVLVEVPKVPLEDRKNTYKLRWVMW